MFIEFHASNETLNFYLLWWSSVLHQLTHSFATRLKHSICLLLLKIRLPIQCCMKQFSMDMPTVCQGQVSDQPVFEASLMSEPLCPPPLLLVPYNFVVRNWEFHGLVHMFHCFQILAFNRIKEILLCKPTNSLSSEDVLRKFFWSRSPGWLIVQCTIVWEAQMAVEALYNCNGPRDKFLAGRNFTKVNISMLQSFCFLHLSLQNVAWRNLAHSVLDFGHLW